MSEPWRTWMPLDIGRYLKKTGHLSTTAHGAYLLLIIHHWDVGALPKEDDDLAAICRMSVREWRKIKPKIEPFFQADWTHRTVLEELAKAEERYRKRSRAGRDGGLAKALHDRERVQALEEPQNSSDLRTEMPEIGYGDDVAESCPTPSNATPLPQPGFLNALAVTHTTTSSIEEVWVSVRERVLAAFAAAGSPNTPDTSRVEIWKSRGHDPEVCVATVIELVRRKPSIASLTYFDQAIANNHAAPQPNARAGPRQVYSRDARHEVLAELEAATDGTANRHNRCGEPSDDPDRPAIPRIERVR